MFGCTHMPYLYPDLGIIVLVRWLTLSQTSLNRIIILKTELFTVMNSFAGAVKV